MECSKCNFRSAIGYCGITHELLCEECGVHCDQCGMFVGAEHVYETRKGVKLCPKCQDERRARKSDKHKKHPHDREPAPAQKGSDTSLAALESEAPLPGELEDEEVAADEVVLSRSGYRKWQPWQFSMLLAVFGVIGATLIIVFPSFRGITLGDGSYFPMAYIVVFLPILAFVWAFIGLTYAKFWEDREKCLASSGLGILAIIMLFGSWFTDPVRYVEQQTEIAVKTRDDMNSKELDRWREGVLDRYR
ncbi:MAG TPA: hypothetical protein PLJ71_02995 [Candidatus Hydrogenedentes bacterium]|nr:hypothetical protein [Candidatus Hydrogenedentota bacterium]HQM47623.1 hypothetical protein [Candidatus Hydrogenedentota bacterium]